MFKYIKNESALLLGAFAVVFFKLTGDGLFSTGGVITYSILSLVLIYVVMKAIFSVVRHSDALAFKLGDPYGTLILTLSVVLLEVIMISSVMLTGESNPVLARDTMFAVTMAVLNGLVGIALLIGGWKYKTQRYNVDGLKAYIIGIIPLSLLCLVLPNFSGGEQGELSTTLTWTLVFASIAVYSVFLFIQTKSHSHFFVDDEHAEELYEGLLKGNWYHGLLLVSYLLVVIMLAKSLAIPINDSISVMGAPQALGGLVVALIVLAPEAVGGIKAALNNQLQRAMNLYFGSVLATIALTVPSVLLISGMMSESIRFGLETAEMVLLCTTLLMTSVSFSSGRTNSLNGATHIILFAVYLIMIFE